MSYEEVRMAAQMYALVAEMNAVLARMEGMNAFNTERDRNGMTLAYDEGAFAVAERELEQIAKRLREEI